MTTTTSTSRRSSSSGHGLAIRCSTRSDGDFHRTNQPPDSLESVRRAFVDLPWTMLDQRHGTHVVRVDTPGRGDGTVGDIAISNCVDAVLGCWVADCAPLVLIGDGREFAVVHAGWRGLAAGVIDAAIDAFTEPVVEALLGPAIGPCCYEFSRPDLGLVAAGVGVEPDAIASTTTWASLALDVPAAVAAACRARGIPLRDLIDGRSCTGCRYDGFSHRVRSEPQRHVVAVWRPCEAVST